jgi:class 3 adenylate cyclase
MDILAVLEQVRALLHKHGHISYRILKLQFQLDEERLEALKEELIEIEGFAVDKDGKMLVWIGESAQVGAQQPSAAAQRVPRQAKPTTQASSKAATSPGSGRKTGATRQRAPEAERRQLTVEFIDLVGSTALSARLDPEELRELIRAYQQTSTTVIERYGGYTAQYLGDGLLVYFGYPTAHDDDAARAVRAGLGIIAAVQELNTHLARPLQVRIGIHTGQVVVGEIGGGSKPEQLALGETPNIAARVQGIAEPDEVVMSGATYHLVQGLIDCEERGLHDLKGITASVPLYSVTRESEAQSRFEAAVRTGLTPLVGREEELGLLRRRWEQAKSSEGQVVLLSGEPGIGKSRLVQALKEQVTTEGATRIEFRCSAYH